MTGKSDGCSEGEYKTDVNSRRPISLMQVVCKLMELLIIEYIRNKLENISSI